MLEIFRSPDQLQGQRIVAPAQNELYCNELYCEESFVASDDKRFEDDLKQDLIN